MVTVARPVGGHRATALPAPSEAQTGAPRITLRSAGIVFATIAMLLTALAMYIPQARVDVWTINRVQEIDHVAVETRPELVGHATLFVVAVLLALALGRVERFVETGPGDVLTKLVERNLGELEASVA